MVARTDSDLDSGEPWHSDHTPPARENSVKDDSNAKGNSIIATVIHFKWVPGANTTEVRILKSL
jgi:hypothetical protein